MVLKKRSIKPKPNNRSQLDENEYNPVDKRIVLIYGLSGTGKTTFCATAPQPVFHIDINETGLKSISDKLSDTYRGVYVQSWDALIKKVDLLSTDDYYKTVIIDTITSAQDMRTDIEVGNKPSSFGLDRRVFGKIAGDMKTLIYDLKDLNKNIIFLAHMRTFGLEDEEEAEDILPSRNARLMPSVVATLNGASDIIGNTFISMKNIKVRVKGEKGKTTLVDKRVFKYCMRLGPNPIYVTKIRKPVGIEIPSFIENPKWDDLIKFEGDM